MSSNLRRQNNRDEENVVSNFGHCSHGNDWSRAEGHWEGGGRRAEERDRDGGLAICAKLICQLSAVRRLFREFRPLTATHFSTLTRPSDASVGNLRTGSSEQTGFQPNIRVSHFVHCQLAWARGTWRKNATRTRCHFHVFNAQRHFTAASVPASHANPPEIGVAIFILFLSPSPCLPSSLLCSFSFWGSFSCGFIDHEEQMSFGHFLRSLHLLVVLSS